MKDYFKKVKKFIFISIILYIYYNIYNIYRPKVQKVGTGNIKIACIGDSITFGFGVLFFRRLYSYPAILAKVLGNNYTTLNYGASGRTLLNFGNKPYYKTNFLKASLKQKPNIVIIMLGTNDSKLINWNKTEYEKQYLYLIKKYKSMLKSSKIYIMIPPKSFNKVKNNTHIRNKIIKNEIKPIIKNIAEKADVKVINLYKLTKDNPNWFIDGIHPNKTGNIAIANHIAKAIQQDLD